MRLASGSETELIAHIEEQSFPPDEKASLEKIISRQRDAGEYFRVLVDSEDDIIGYVNGTCTRHTYVTHETMETHDPLGQTLVLHSVTIRPDSRRQGHATFMLRAYLESMKELNTINLVLLLCKADLCAFYIKCGFQLVGISSVVHGQDPWFEMSFNLICHRQLKQYQIDAFTSEAFRGNPAAVVVGSRSVDWMQNMAMENNLAETSFVQPVDFDSLDECLPSNVAVYNIRWFTPAVEVALCGHATLAAAYTLFNYGYLNPIIKSPLITEYIDTIYFNTLFRGTLIAKLSQSTTGQTQIELDFPSQPAQSIDVSSNQHLLTSLFNGLKINSKDLLFLGNSVDDLLVVVTPEGFAQIPSLASGQLNFAEISLIEARGVIVTCVGPKSESTMPLVSPISLSPFRENFSQANFLSRFFAPKVGVNEDPVTGSAHTVLTPYWCEKLGQAE